MDITKTVIEERNRALLGGDHSTYHAQATRRIHSLRKRLGITTPKGRKYSPKAPVTAEDVGKNTQWVYLLLASAERAWAEAMAMKSLQSPENTQKPLPGATKKQINSRFTRAINYANNLVEVLSDQATSQATAEDLLEAKAYLSLLKGGSDFERNRWASCIQNYALTRQVYVALSTVRSTSLYQEMLDGTIEPSIRYAAYQEKLPRSKGVSDIAIERFPADESASREQILSLDSTVFETSAEKVASATAGIDDLPTSLDWRGRTVKLEDASISASLAAARAKESDLSKHYSQSTQTNAKQIATTYDEVIEAYQDTADTVKTVIDELLAEGVDQGDSRVQSLQIIRTAINYSVIERRIGRNRVLCGARDGIVFQPEVAKHNKKHSKDDMPRAAREEPTGRKIARLRERVALYDLILQNLDAVKQLPGVIADEGLIQEIDGKKSYFRALKCLSIGRSHSVNGQIINALALYAKASSLAQIASSSIGSSESSTESIPRLDVSTAYLEELSSHLDSATLQYRALAELKNINSSEQASTKQPKPFIQPLVERLNNSFYDDEIDLHNIVDYPPKLRPVPMKPIFFDLAWNHIGYPGQEPERTATPAHTPAAGSRPQTPSGEPAKKKSGWFSFGR